MSIRNIQKKIWLKNSGILYNLSPIIATKILFFFSMKKRLNLNNPKTFNEKIQWLKLYWQDPRVAKCADKYDLREYVEQCGISEILNPIYGVYRNVDDINFNELPKKFALKGTHGCGYNLICKNKYELDIEKAKETAKKWLKSRYAYTAAEVQYDKMEPKIIIEKFIDGIDGESVIDYKVFCFNGKPYVTMVCEERGENKRAKYYFYDNEWNIKPYNNESKNIINEGHNKHANKPKSFDDMIRYSKILSKPFPFVRVDFYDVNGKPILGEMTFTPCGGIDSRLDSKIDLLLGKLIKLPEKYIES
ncbi:glycosyl transferase [Clostridium perfringens]